MAPTEKRRAVSVESLRPWFDTIAPSCPHDSQKILILVREALVARLMAGSFQDFLRSTKPEWLQEETGIELARILELGAGESPTPEEILLLSEASPLSAYQVAELAQKL